MWRPSPMSTCKFPDDIEYIATDPSCDRGHATWTRHPPQILGYTQLVNPDLDPWHGLREAVGKVAREVDAELVRRDWVADQDHWRLRIDVGPDGVVVVAKVKTWPAIPGLTAQDQG